MIVRALYRTSEFRDAQQVNAYDVTSVSLERETARLYLRDDAEWSYLVSTSVSAGSDDGGRYLEVRGVAKLEVLT